MKLQQKTICKESNKSVVVDVYKAKDIHMLLEMKNTFIESARLSGWTVCDKTRKIENENFIISWLILD